MCMGVGGAYGGWWVSDGVRVTINHVHAHLAGLGGVGQSIIKSGLDTIGPVGRSQRSQREPA